MSQRPKSGVGNRATSPRHASRPGPTIAALLVVLALMVALAYWAYFSRR